MHVSLFLSLCPTALALAFAGWASYEDARSNNITSHHIQYSDDQRRRENAVKAITRFDDEIMPDVRYLLHNTSDALSANNYIRAITLILKIDRWFVYVSSNIADENIIKSRVYSTLRNVSVRYDYVTHRIMHSGAYNIDSYIDLLHKFNII